MRHSRQLRRKVKRAMVNNTIDTETTNKMIDTYIDLPKHKQDMYNNALADMVLLFAGFQRVYEKRGKKKITEAVEQFVNYCNEMSSNRVKRNNITGMLEKETRYKFFEHAGELELLVKEQKENQDD